ncbi:MAG: DNA repair protein RecO [Candidatus Yanofskybacteria bacterium RIFCSPHIGHO2_01_FULL_45_42]|uniref:DNA repair protein RecO n=3 Tax=Candidatus Yanofskyibacteriota TaxID=1752733 RepID=A0A1F8F6H3_9BACT|nr:MAG: DNA repair protein RecO [Candidatus Yanofskybacteria bacterium RIFCSPHIGHO2_01_FULL_45_42]
MLRQSSLFVAYAYPICPSRELERILTNGNPRGQLRGAHSAMRAIILKKQDTNEYDQWVTCYTKEFGKLTAVAKSVLKPGSIQGMHLDVLNLVDFELISGRGMPIISAAQVENSYRNLKSSYKSIAAAYFFLETIDKLVFENDSDPILWKFLVETLENLDKNGYDAATFKRRQIKLLEILGYFHEASIINPGPYFEYHANVKFHSLPLLKNGRI